MSMSSICQVDSCENQSSCLKYVSRKLYCMTKISNHATKDPKYDAASKCDFSRKLFFFKKQVHIYILG